jgi:hypothetical protein
MFQELSRHGRLGGSGLPGGVGIIAGLHNGFLLLTDPLRKPCRTEKLGGLTVDGLKGNLPIILS